MNRADFINSLDYETLKKTLAKVLKTNSELILKRYKSGNFKLDLKEISGPIGIISSEAYIAKLFTSQLKIRHNNGIYEAKIIIKLSNKSGEYLNEIGTIKLVNNKFIFIQKTI